MSWLSNGISLGSVTSMRIGNAKRMESLESYAAQSPDRILESFVRAALHESSYHEMARVRCTVQERVLTLTGRVSCYYLKQIAQRIAFDSLKGTAKIVNHLKVES
jgi:osmotically-inducible protein OsmY